MPQCLALNLSLPCRDVLVPSWPPPGWGLLPNQKLTLINESCHHPAHRKCHDSCVTFKDEPPVHQELAHSEPSFEVGGTVLDLERED